MGNKITTREGFISDNLVNIGKRLQINHDLQNAADRREDVQPAVEKLSVRRAAADRTEAERLLRELGDRIGHEAAAVNAELEQMAERRMELERFRDFLADSASGLEQLDPASGEALRKLEELRYRFFTASGRAQRFYSFRGGVGGGASTGEFEHKTCGTLWREALPLVLALIFSALLIGAAVIYSLR